MTIDVLEDSSVVLSDTSSCTCSRNGVAESLIEGDEVRMYSMYSIVLCYVFYINFLRIFSLLLEHPLSSNRIRIKKRNIQYFIRNAFDPPFFGTDLLYLFDKKRLEYISNVIYLIFIRNSVPR